MCAAMMSLRAQCAKRWTGLLNWIERPWRRDYVWTSFLCEQRLTPKSWDGPVLPQIGGSSLPVECSFWPTEVAITEVVTATFQCESHARETATVSIEVENCGDLVMVSEITQPIPAQLLSANRHGLRRVRWPHVSKGVNLSATFTVEPTVLNRVIPPPGFLDDDLKEIHVKARVFISGPRTRT